MFFRAPGASRPSLQMLAIVLSLICRCAYYQRILIKGQEQLLNLHLCSVALWQGSATAQGPGFCLVQLCFSCGSSTSRSSNPLLLFLSQGRPRESSARTRTTQLSSALLTVPRHPQGPLTSSSPGWGSSR